MTTSVQLQLVLLYMFRKLLFCLHGTIQEVNSATFYIKSSYCSVLNHHCMLTSRVNTENLFCVF